MGWGKGHCLCPDLGEVMSPHFRTSTVFVKERLPVQGLISWCLGSCHWTHLPTHLPGLFIMCLCLQGSTLRAVIQRVNPGLGWEWRVVPRGLRVPLGLVLTSAHSQDLPALKVGHSPEPQGLKCSFQQGRDESGPSTGPQGPSCLSLPSPKGDLPFFCLSLGWTASFQGKDGVLFSYAHVPGLASGSCFLFSTHLSLHLPLCLFLPLPLSSSTLLVCLCTTLAFFLASLPLLCLFFLRLCVCPPLPPPLCLPHPRLLPH